MAKKVSVKTFTDIFLFYATVMVLCSCQDPVNIPLFLKTPQVEGIIEKSKEAVIVDDKTSHKGLVRGKGKISGLKNDKYYMVEKELDADGKNVPKYNPNEQEDEPVGTYPLYVTDNRPDAPGIPGTLYILGYISMIKEGAINGLENFHTYTVRDALAFPDDTAFTYNVGGAAQELEVTVKNGEINIPASMESLTLDLTANLTNLTDLTDDATYEIIAVSKSVTPKWNTFAGGYSNSINTAYEGFASEWSALPLEAAGTTVDYVIVKTDAPIKFMYLRVNVILVEVQFTITLTPGDLITAPTSDNFTLQRGSYDGEKTITLTLAVPADGGTWENGSIVWSINAEIDADAGIAANHNSTLTINNGGIYNSKGLLAADSFIVSVTAKKDNTPYSAKVVINVVD